ncbi:hypothetical protein BDN67DRAFT_984310 [Paxillus ammoniavirescens]|nr:hypothetical protein BDN67DRAFT_984310 [Paxillus ammoniavirescens]
MAHPNDLGPISTDMPLSKAKEAYQQKKLRRDLEEAQTRSEGDTIPQFGQPENTCKTGNPPAHSDDHRNIVPNPEQPVPSTCRSPVPEDDTLSLAQQRPHQLNHRLPLRFQDMLPDGPLPLSLPGIELPEGLPQGSFEFHIPRSRSPPPSVVCWIFKTQHNKFVHFTPIPMKAHYGWGTGIGTMDRKSLRKASRIFSISLETWTSIQKTFEI